jgi:hypothetical protein
MMVEIRPAMPGDCWLILSALREQEVAELAALGHTSEECIRLGLTCGNAMTVFIAGKPAGVFGLADYGEVQVPWAVFTGVIDQHPVAFLRACKRWRESVCGTLVQCVDARNTQAVRWFKWLGFDVSDAEPFGVNGEPFHHVRVS